MESYRGWRIKRRDDDSTHRLLGLVPKEPAVQLQSASANTIWASSTMTAVCAHGCDIKLCLGENHACQCGVYSLKDPKALMEAYGYLEVYGVVFNHGVVVEGEKGFRSEKVTIRVLYTSDFELGKELKEAYPDVSIMLPPKELMRKTPKVREPDWRSRYAKKLARAAAMEAKIAQYKRIFYGGPEFEKQRLMRLLKGANRQKVIEFAKEYASNDEWAARNWQGHIQKRTKNIKPGDMVFEANDDTHPYVFIGSTRPNAHQSMRYLFDRNGILVKRPNIRRWDEEPYHMEARKRAIEEWE